jgi:hypothetical protein
MAKALVIVAHPDDETIWCGGQMLSKPGQDWAVLSLCRAFDRDRAPKFRRACEKLGAKCAMSDLEDEHPEQKLASLDEVKERIRAMMKELGIGSRFDALYTHGRNGEYGHNRHKEVHRAVRDMLCSGELCAKKVFFFDYVKARDGFYCVARGEALHEGEVGRAHSSARARTKGNAGGRSKHAERNARAVTRLSARIAREKALLITSTYEFSKDSFEARSARAIEAFEVEAKTCDR